MSINELYLKTVFCCMACDGDIAEEEIAMIHSLCKRETWTKEINTEETINKWIKEINENGVNFLIHFISEINGKALKPNEQLKIVELAIRTIEADAKIEYSEVKFFKRIRKRLTISDETILEQHPDKDDFLLPDIIEPEITFTSKVHFEAITLNEIK